MKHTIINKTTLHWMFFSINSLLISGLISIILILGKTPIIKNMLNDSFWVKKCLIIHVNLSLNIWLLSFFTTMAIYKLIKKHNIFLIYLVKFLYLLIFISIFTLLSTNAKPILSNYIPIINHNLFIAPLLIFFLIIILINLSLPMKLKNEEFFLQQLFFSGKIILLVSLINLGLSLLKTPTKIESYIFFDLICWGIGHTLQFLNVLGLTIGWYILLKCKYKIYKYLYFIMIAPIIISPLLALKGTTTYIYYNGFKFIMKYAFCLYLTISTYKTLKYYVFLQKKIKQNQNNIYFINSLILLIIGIILGLNIKEQNTIIPAHYHASIGAITVTYMALTPLMLENMGIKINRKIAKYQINLFTIGQIIFSIGFAISGTTGALRKTFVNEQDINSITNTIGLYIMSLGGFIAIIGGIIFIICYYKIIYNNL